MPHLLYIMQQMWHVFNWGNWETIEISVNFISGYLPHFALCIFPIVMYYVMQCDLHSC